MLSFFCTRHAHNEHHTRDMSCRLPMSARAKRALDVRNVTNVHSRIVIGAETAAWS